MVDIPGMESVVDTGDKAVDGSRLHSILLDARASKASENMFQIADGLLGNEKENAKRALEHLWALKRTIETDGDTGTLDLLIQHYQDKLNILRHREQNVRRLSKESRSLLEEKRKRDAEFTKVKNEIEECTAEFERLSEQLHKLKAKEQELGLIGRHLNKELQINTNEIVNGLYEIILSQQSIEAGGATTAPPAPAYAPRDPEVAAAEPSETGQSATEAKVYGDETDDGEGKTGEAAEEEGKSEKEVVDQRGTVAIDIPPLYPKSVVKTTKGTVVGEYYYDPKAQKGRRHYIYNGSFLLTQLGEARYAEAAQIMQDATRRVETGPNLHFEEATEEILNVDALREALEGMRKKRYDGAAGLCDRLEARIAELGGRYNAMLGEQMSRLVES
jgi:hypothetical protein